MPLKLLRHLGLVNATLLASLSVIVLIGSGCGGPTAAPAQSPPAVQQSLESAAVPVAPTVTQLADDPTRHLVRESWDLALISGAKVGHSHFQEYATRLGEQPVRELISSNEMTIQRFGQTVTQNFELTSVETLDGQVLRFETKMLTGPSEQTITGEYRGDKMLIETGTLGKTQASSIDWNPTWGGYFADQLSLKQNPMQPGEERKVIALVAGTAQTGEVAIKAMQRESVKLLDGERDLLRIESSLNIAGTKINSIMWADETGDVLKMSMPGLNHETYRTTKEIALRPVETTEFDLGAQSVVKVDKPLPSPHKTTRVVYRARLANSSPAVTFSNCRSQSVKKLDDRTAEITVQAIRPESANVADSASSGPTEADLQPNNLIQSDDGAIVSLAERFAEGQTDPWKLAKIFEFRVGEFVHSKNFSQAISSASDVVRSQEGDCTEHAVLLAALCRAKGIPARVAIGLVYYGPAQGFAYHMWNEVWIADGWVPIDSTLGLGGIGAGHLKIADSALSSASPVAALLPVVEVIGQLELEVLSVE